VDPRRAPGPGLLWLLPARSFPSLAAAARHARGRSAACRARNAVARGGEVDLAGSPVGGPCPGGVRAHRRRADRVPRTASPTAACTLAAPSARCLSFGRSCNRTKDASARAEIVALAARRPARRSV
jgi:uncharacterized protein (DUF1786 family)